MPTFATESADLCPLTEKQAVEQINSMIEHAGLDPAIVWPMDRATAAAVLVANEYACNPEELHRLGRMGQIPNVEMIDAKDFVCIAGCLEARGQWQLTPSAAALQRCGRSRSARGSRRIRTRSRELCTAPHMLQRC